MEHIGDIMPRVMQQILANWSGPEDNVDEPITECPNCHSTEVKLVGKKLFCYDCIHRAFNWGSDRDRNDMMDDDYL